MIQQQRLMAAGVAAITAIIFVADLLSPLRGVVAAFYAIPILLAARTGRARILVAVGGGAAVLAVVAFLIPARADTEGGGVAGLAAALILIAASTLLSMREGAPPGVASPEQRGAETELQVMERRYSAIFHAAGFATWESDWTEMWALVQAASDGHADVRAWLAARPDALRNAARHAVIRDVNHAAVKLFGGESREALIGGNILGAYLKASESAFGNMLAMLSEGAEVAEIEARFRALNGRIVDVLLWVTPLHEGEPWSRILVMAHDITERNEARAKLEQASAELAHAARVSTLGQLAASIAHEVNQPLAAIINYGKSGKRWLSRETPDLAEAADCLDHIVINGSRAAEVLERVRALARKGPPRLAPLDLAELIGEAVSLVQREANAADVSVRRAIEPGLPPAFGDRVQVQQVVVNLLINAIQAMQAVTGRPRELRIEAIRDRDGEDVLRVAVRDSGTGIDGEPARIFTPFFTTKPDGMGMGLSICRSIIEAQGGHINAFNNPDAGATVAFTLPAAPATPRAGA